MMSTMLFSLFVICRLGSSSAIDPAAAFARKVAAGSPSAECVLVRMAADFTGDGLLDLALSSTCGWDDAPGWGSAGGSWELWAQRVDEDTTYCFVDRVFFHPYAVSVIAVDSAAILTTYHRMGAGRGYLVRDRVAGSSMARLEERFVTISPDSAATWYDEVFPASNRLPCEACRLSDYLVGEPVWVEGYHLPPDCN